MGRTQGRSFWQSRVQAASSGFPSAHINRMTTNVPPSSREPYLPAQPGRPAQPGCLSSCPPSPRFLHPWENKAGRSQSITDEHLPFRARGAPTGSCVRGWVSQSFSAWSQHQPHPTPAGSEAPGASPEICLSNATRSPFWPMLKFENHCIN